MKSHAERGVNIEEIQSTYALRRYAIHNQIKAVRAVKKL
jgi:hypothetical protein